VDYRVLMAKKRPQKRVKKLAKKSPKKLLYRTVGHNGGLVFAEPRRALVIDRIHRAIAESTTWEEFRKAIPRKAYSYIIKIYDMNCERHPRGSATFSGEMLPGWTEGDFPPWLQREMGSIGKDVEDVWRQFGRLENTFLNGSFWFIPPEQENAVCAALRAIGWEVEHAPELQFW